MDKEKIYKQNIKKRDSEELTQKRNEPYTQSDKKIESENQEHTRNKKWISTWTHNTSCIHSLNHLHAHTHTHTHTLLQHHTPTHYPTNIFIPIHPQQYTNKIFHHHIQTKTYNHYTL